MTSWQSKSLKAYYRLNRLLHPSADEVDIDHERTWLEEAMARYGPKVELESSAVRAGSVPAEWLVLPGSLTQRVVLYLHGGSYCLGSLDTHRGLAATIAGAAQARALLIEYRLAPEHRFPAAVLDARAAYDWLLDQGIRPNQIALVGDSAGGGLVLALLASLSDAGRPLPIAGVCLSPWADLSLSGRSWTTNARRELVLSAAIMRQMGQLYLGDADPLTPLASPLYADLTGLPPLLIQVGGDEALLSDAEEVAARAKAAGVEVELEVWPGMFHVWQLTSRAIPEARQAIERIGAFLQARFAEAV
jgi:monoterpene epsilon-lactone hydrolase